VLKAIEDATQPIFKGPSHPVGGQLCGAGPVARLHPQPAAWHEVPGWCVGAASDLRLGAYVSDSGGLLPNRQLDGEGALRERETAPWPTSTAHLVVTTLSLADERLGDPQGAIEVSTSDSNVDSAVDSVRVDPILAPLGKVAAVRAQSPSASDTSCAREAIGTARTLISPFDLWTSIRDERTLLRVL
jgi:hypothetical protein